MRRQPQWEMKSRAASDCKYYELKALSPETGEGQSDPAETRSGQARMIPTLFVVYRDAEAELSDAEPHGYDQLSVATNSGVIIRAGE